MKKNIAILIGNSEYTNFDNLDCCLNDVASIRELLDRCKKFDKIFEYKNEEIDRVKDQLRELSSEIKDVDELLLYFTGHGYSDDSDFFMCFKGFSSGAPNTTGLSRNDLHDILRSFDASLVVNIVDACNAGRNLIKSDYEPLTKRADFKNYIQYSACTEEQNAFGGETLSVFTRELRAACVRKTSGVVYYTDVESSLRDAFVGNARQTPHIMKQGTLQEIFCADAANLDTIRQKISAESTPDAEPAVEFRPQSEFEAAWDYLEELEKQIPSSQDAQSFIEAVAEHVLDTSRMESELRGFFECRLARYDDYEQVENKRAVVRLLAGRQRDDTFVGSGVTREKRRESFYGALTSYMYAPIYDETAYLDNNCQLKNVHVKLYFEPKFMNLKRPVAEIAFLPSLRECLVLTTTGFQKRSGWGSFDGGEAATQWKWTACGWSADAREVAKGIHVEPLAIVRSYVRKIGESVKGTA